MFQNIAWKNKTSLSFSTFGNDNSLVSKNGEIVIQTIKIDDIVKNDAITLIKMDIEGSEREAIIGASNTIRRNKPRLCISVYHKPKDIIDLPIVLKELVPSYKFYLRHYPFNSYADTVLFAQV